MSNPATRFRGEFTRVYLIIALLMSPAAFANESPLETLLVGGAIISVEKPYPGIRSTDKKLYAPVVRWHWNNIFVDGLYGNEMLAGYTFFKNRDLSVSALGRLNTMGYDASDSVNLFGMADRDWALEAGAEVAWKPTRFGVRSQVFADVTSEHEGQEVRAEVTWEAADKGWKAEYAAGVIWQSSDMVDYYFGVLPNEATVDRPAYAPGSEFSARAGGTLSYDLIWPITLLFHAEWRWLGDDINSSPIVNSRGQWTLGGGIMYRFGKTSRAQPRGYRR